MEAEPQITQSTSRWGDRHQKLAEELTSWIANPDVRSATIHQVLEYFKNEKKATGDLERWFRRAIQNAFFRNQIWGKEWTVEHDQFTAWCTSWIPDPGIRDHVISCFRDAFLKQKDPPVQPSYWIRRIINPAFRKECKMQGIPLANKWTEESLALARTLAAKQGIPEDVRDSVVSRVWQKFAIAVEPIEKLEHWMNNVISTEFMSEITETAQEKGGWKWPVLTQVKGTKEDVDKALRTLDKKEQMMERVLEQEESMERPGPSSPIPPMPAPENYLFLERLFLEHEKRSGLSGKLSRVVIELCSDEVGYTSSELGQHLHTPAEEIENFIDHDYGELRLIAKDLGMTGWTL